MKNREIHFVLFLFLVCLPIFFLSPMPHAHAFKRSTMKEDPNTTLIWQQPFVDYYVNYSTFPKFAEGDLKSAVNKGFSAWNDVACSCFTFRNMGESKRTTAFLNTTGKPIEEINEKTNKEVDFQSAINIVAYTKQNWLGPSDAFAITNPIYKLSGEDKGSLVAFELFLNGVHFKGALKKDDKIEPGVYDIQAVMTHEAGHALGLDHSEDGKSTMFFLNSGNTRIRKLQQDDKNGLCTIYPLEECPGCSCSQQKQRPSDGSFVLFLVGLLFLLFIPLKKLVATRSIQ